MFNKITFKEKQIYVKLLLVSEYWKFALCFYWLKKTVALCFQRCDFSALLVCWDGWIYRRIETVRVLGEKSNMANNPAKADNVNSTEQSLSDRGKTLRVSKTEDTNSKIYKNDIKLRKKSSRLYLFYNSILLYLFYNSIL